MGSSRTMVWVLLYGAFMLSQAQAQAQLEAPGAGATPDRPPPSRIEPATRRDQPDVPEGRRRAPPDAEEANADAAQEQMAGAEAEAEERVAQLDLPAVNLDDVVRAAHVTAHANAVFAQYRADLMRAQLSGDEAEYRALHRMIQDETAIAAREVGIDMETYHEVLRSVQQYAIVSQRFFATLTDAGRR
jgi:hypothetical protein